MSDRNAGPNVFHFKKLYKTAQNLENGDCMEGQGIVEIPVYLMSLND